MTPKGNGNDPRREGMLRYLEGSMEPGDLKELNDSLRSDAPLRKEFAELLVLRAQLFDAGREARNAAETAQAAETLAGSPEIAGAPSPPARSKRVRDAWIAALASAACLAVVVGALLSGGGSVKRTPEPPRPTFTTVTRFGGDVVLLREEVPTPLLAPQPLPPGSGLETRAAGSFAELEFPDGTRMRLEEHTRLFRGDGSIVIFHGILTCRILKASPGRSRTFRTPHAEVEASEGMVRITVRPDAERTRVEVKSGQATLRRLADGATVSVDAGTFAIAGKNEEIAPVPRNRLANAGFEEGGLGWRIERSEKIDFVPVSPPRSGRAMRATPDPANPHSVSQIVSVAEGDTYVATGWIRTDGAGGRLLLEWLDDRNRVLDREVVGEAQGTIGWRAYSGRFKVPGNCRTTRFRLSIPAGVDGAGSVWFDELTFAVDW